MKKRLELECICKTCKIGFCIWENLFPTEIGSGFFISQLKCPNCQTDTLTFDIILREVKDE